MGQKFVTAGYENYYVTNDTLDLSFNELRER
jgi:hypothetical protein